MGRPNIKMHFPLTVGTTPLSAGETALAIENMIRTEDGLLTSRVPFMQAIPDAWQDPDGPPLLPQDGIDGIIFIKKYNQVPEGLVVISSNTRQSTFYRFVPWWAGDSPAGVQYGPFWECKQHTAGAGVAPVSVVLTERRRGPVVMREFNSRVFISLGDNGRIWTWNGGTRVVPLGFIARPSAPSVAGPAPQSNAEGQKNAGGFSLRGRIGSTESSFLNIAGEQVGGIDDGEWRYKVVFEGEDGSYSETSAPSGAARIYRDVAVTGTDAWQPDLMLRCFRVYNIPKGPDGTRARILLRTRNLRRLPEGDFGDYCFLARLSENVSTDFIDNIPDGDLGPIWEDRMAIPQAVRTLEAYNGSMFFCGSEQYPARIWWSEQTAFGAIPGSILKNAYMDIDPQTGAIQAALATPNGLLLWKERATYLVSGSYPNWQVTPLSLRAGCVGPDLPLVLPDGSVVWYGANSFWRLSEKGVEDVGVFIRDELAKVNHQQAQRGVAWVGANGMEAYFILPTEANETNNRWFIWDCQTAGWRFGDFMEDVTCAVVTPWGHEWLAGSLAGERNIWVKGKGTPLEPHVARFWKYILGWNLGSDTAQYVGAATGLREIHLMQKETWEGGVGTKLYRDWNLDDFDSYDELPAAHADDEDVRFFGSATLPVTYNESLWRRPRYILGRFNFGGESCNVWAVQFSSLTPTTLGATISLSAFLTQPGTDLSLGGNYTIAGGYSTK